MYNTILLFIVALYLFNISLPGDPSWFAPWLFPLILGSLGGIYYLLAKVAFSRWKIPYDKAEIWVSWLALCFFELIIICCQPGYYLAKIPFVEKITVVQSAGGLLIFIGLLALMWVAGREFSPVAAGNSVSNKELISANFRIILPLILPWLLVLLFYDLANLFPFPWLHAFADSPYGFIVFALLALLVLPALARRVWGCTPMPDGPQRQHLEAFGRRLKFVTKFYLWPLHRGRALTAAVVGLIPGFRYVLLTPALLEVMDEKEVEAVLAHEIGHVKKWHLFLSILLIAGFSVVITTFIEPVVYSLAQLSFLTDPLFALGLSGDTAFTLIASVPALLMTLLFFRFVFGYFLRNFERQADLYSFSVVGSAAPLISTFEKLLFYGGGDRKERNWHHFGLGERIACLQGAENHFDRVKRHNRKVWLSLVGYFMLVGLVLFAGKDVLPFTSSQQTLSNQRTASDQVFLFNDGVRFADVYQQAVWYRQLADAMIAREEERRGLELYEASLQLVPSSPVTLNNLAWLLITSNNPELRDPVRALDLARKAVRWYPAAAFYDTLAEAYWANGMTEEALQAEEKAMVFALERQQDLLFQQWGFSSRANQQESEKKNPLRIERER